MVKALSLTFQQCLGTFTMLLFEGSLEMGPFRHWSNKVFWVGNFGNTSGMRVIVFKKFSKLQLDSKNPEKKSEKYFYFWDNCISIGCVKLSLLKIQYLPSALSVLGKSIEILHVTSRDFLQVNNIHSDQ